MLTHIVVQLSMGLLLVRILALKSKIDRELEKNSFLAFSPKNEGKSPKIHEKREN